MGRTRKHHRGSEPRPGRVASLVGVVESDRRDKTRTVVVTRLVRHPKYGKYVRHATVLQAHDETNASRLGDTVEVVPCRPLSRTKSWRIVRVVGRGETPPTIADLGLSEPGGAP